MAFGIDFGTTNTAVVKCLLTDQGMTLTPYGENDQPVPSLVALHPEKSSVFGWEVKKRRSQLIASGYHVISSFKSILGTKEYIAVGEKQYSPIDITALFLSYVKEQVEKRTGENLKDAVIAIPVDFKPEQRRDLREAAKRAGIKVKSFVSEPTAAYVSCRREMAGASNVVVFDWGGGTLDVSLISVEGCEVSELAVAGRRLGGNDIDLMLAKHIHAKIMHQAAEARSFEDLSPAERDNIIGCAEEAKKRLSGEEFSPIRLMRYAGKTIVRDSVSLDEFSRLIESSVNEAVKLMDSAVKKAGVGLGQMDALLMVGGSCEMQAIFQRIEKIGEEFGLTIYRPDKIQWSVAGGAAILSEQQPAYKLQNAFGVVLSDDSFYPVFEVGTKIPCKAQELRFGVVEDTNNAVFVFADQHKNVLERTSVPIKGFTSEGIHLQCEIDDDMIAHVAIFSDYAQRMGITKEINQLAFTYWIE